ncbi:hypothetical protein KY285_006833 [Solanum tuberosum]|nr:hypothetical protein KY285_006833 [Solanum tuberosum]
MASSSSSFASDSQYRLRWKYDVFLSFRGVDTRRTFTSHLYEGLKNRGIYTFQDDIKLENGDSIPEELLKAIEESQVALVIFSKNYATSRWCLNELVKIMECKEENGQIVIPIFYDVDPSEVRKQTKSFAEAFTEHESKYANDIEGMQKVKGWRTALSDAADLKGYDISNGARAWERREKEEKEEEKEKSNQGDHRGFSSGVIPIKLLKLLVVVDVVSCVVEVIVGCGT